MAQTYMLDEKGRLFRNEEQIGEVVDGDIHLEPQYKKYVAPVTRWYSKYQKEQEAKDAEPKIDERPKLTPAQQEEADLRGVAKEAREEAKAALSDWRDDTAFAEKSNGKVPKPPKKNPRFGDKTPAYVEWLHEYRPDKFHAKFVNKGKGKVPVFEKDSDGIERHVGWEDAEFTLRKTHMTEKAESNATLPESHDWDA